MKKHPFINGLASLLACGYIANLLPGFAAEQDPSHRPPLTGKSLPVMPMTVPPENALAYEVSQKPALASKGLSDMESLEHWEPWVGPSAFGTIALSKDKYYQGHASVLLTSATKGEKPNYASTRGRPWGSGDNLSKIGALFEPPETQAEIDKRIVRQWHQTLQNVSVSQQGEAVIDVIIPEAGNYHFMAEITGLDGQPVRSWRDFVSTGDPVGAPSPAPRTSNN